MQGALELAAHWQWVYLVVGITCLAVLVIAKRAWWPLIPSLVLGVSFFVQSGTLDRSTEPLGAKPVLQVATANLNFDTMDFTAVVGWLTSDDAPDVVFLQEFTGLAQQALQSPEVAQRYPHRVEVPQPDQFGLAILSRYPLSEVQKVEPADMQATLRLRATVTWAGGPVRLSAIHPMPPLNAAYAQLRDQALVEEARHLSQSGGLALMAGDFNTTPWAKGLFAIDAQLRRANGLAGSWPNAFGGLSILPLDHVLASSGWQLVDSCHGPDVGSDHRPVVVRLVAR
uniref:endonuclease/exonuclease/phosphatase family protein n=1 Tax=uncultured Acidovorax sp. TaxID=158751 RepID=UPI00076A6D5D|nr:endonuclease/exonuclease/phosphatase family protein [uncultured Acidovorax sp.]